MSTWKIFLTRDLGVTQLDLDKLQLAFDDDSKQIDPGNGVKYVNTAMHMFKKEEDDRNLQEVWNFRRFAPSAHVVIDDDTFRDGNQGLNFRPFGALVNWAVINPALEGMLKIVLEMMRPDTDECEEQVEKGDDAKTKHDVMIETAFQQVESGGKNRCGNASPEGIHQDGDDVVLVVFMNRHNVKAGGESRLYDINVQSGPFGPGLEDERRTHLLTKPFVMTKPFEAFLILDQKLKHEARGVLEPILGNRRAYRNVISFHARRPHADGSDDIVLKQAVPMPEHLNTEREKTDWLDQTVEKESRRFKKEMEVGTNTFGDPRRASAIKRSARKR